MKPIGIMISILIFLIGGGILNYIYIEKSSDKLIKQVIDIEEEIYNKNWKEAEKSINIFNKKLDSTKQFWNVLLDHNLIYNMELASAKLGEYVKNKSVEESLSETASLKRMMQHIIEEERFSIVNIL